MQSKPGVRDFAPGFHWIPVCRLTSAKERRWEVGYWSGAQNYLSTSGIAERLAAKRLAAAAKRTNSDRPPR